MTQKPGIMLYFEMVPCLAHLDDAQAGRLLRAMLHYGQTGEVPDFDDVALEMAWAFVQLRLDQDEERYRQTVENKRRAARLRWHHADASTAMN